jgi:hypothetical protein
VVIPSYVVFNHVCWKLLQLDLADPLTVIRSQAALWQFFWGTGDEAGYVAGLTEPEQLAALEILDAHSAEAVLLCSLLQAFDEVTPDNTDQEFRAVRDAWRAILASDLWQPSAEALADAATLMDASVGSPIELVELLHDFAHASGRNESREIVATALGVRADAVTTTSGRVNRRGLGEQTVDGIFVIDDALLRLEEEPCRRAVAALRAALPTDENAYLRIEQQSVDTIAFADYASGDWVFANRTTGQVIEGECPTPDVLPWESGLNGLFDLAGGPRQVR